MKLHRVRRVPLIVMLVFSFWIFSCGLAEATTYLYRKAITLTNSSGSQQTNYQLLVSGDYTQTPISEGKMNASGDDIRFSRTDSFDDSDWGVSCDYYLVPSTINTANTQIWVEVDTIPTGESTLYLYYGASVSAASSGANTFLQWDVTGIVALWQYDNSWNSETGVGNASLPGSTYDPEFSTTRARGTYSAYFDGTDNLDVANDSSFNLTTTLSIAAWSYETTASSTNSRTFIDRWASHWSYIQASANTLCFLRFRSGAYAGACSTWTCPVNQWAHYVTTWDSGRANEVIHYLNGANKQEFDLIGPIDSTADAVTIGLRAPSSRLHYWYGYLDQLAFFNRSISDTEVSNLYNGNLFKVTGSTYAIRLYVTPGGTEPTAGTPGNEERKFIPEITIFYLKSIDGD